MGESQEAKKQTNKKWKKYH